MSVKEYQGTPSAGVSNLRPADSLWHMVALYLAQVLAFRARFYWNLLLTKKFGRHCSSFLDGKTEAWESSHLSKSQGQFRAELVPWGLSA